MKKEHKKTYTSHEKTGLNHILTTPANPNTPQGLAAFREMRNASGMSTKEMLHYIGKKSHLPRNVDSDKAKQEERLKTLE
jgi:hypothetical protein